MAIIYGNPTEVEIQGKKVKFDKYLYENMLLIIDMIKKKFDGVIIIDGMEGSGKSELGLQCCLLVDKEFNEDKVVYTAEQFYDKVDNSKPGDAILWDEFVMAGTAAEALSKTQSTLRKKLTIIRKKGLFIVLVIPYIFMLQKYFAIARSRAFINVSVKGLTRGYFHFYDYTQKKRVYIFGYKTWIYPRNVHANFSGRFANWSEHFLDHDLIEEKKEQANDLINESQEATKFTPKQLRHVKLMIEGAKCPFEKQTAEHRAWYATRKKLEECQSTE